MAHLMFQKSSNHSCVCYYFLTILFHPEASICSFFVRCVDFACGFFSLPNSLQFDANDPFLWYIFHNLFMLMFKVLVNSFVLSEVKATKLTFRNRNPFYLFIICLQIMISNGLKLIWLNLISNLEMLCWIIPFCHD